ncbi:MAG: 3-hydroxyacyl-CoA dehydrogenase family protein [Planctomycetota bacterium]
MITNVGVIGTGAMGAGIMQVAAQAGCNVIGRDLNDDALANGLKTIDRMLKIAVRRAGLPQADADAAKARIATTTDVSKLADCDIVIEAAVEVMDIKKKIFGELDKVCKPACIFASNTSALSISEMSTATDRRDRFCGLHFFNPVPMMELLEVVRTDATSDATYTAVTEWGERIGKTCITAKDTPGFIVNFVLMPLLLGAAAFYEKGIATAEDIDAGMRLGCGHPKGPLELLDAIGLDVALHVAETISAAHPGEQQYVAPKILRDLVAAGKLGRKTGEGFYNYNKG